MKKLFAMVSLLTLTLALAACGSNGYGQGAAPSETQETWTIEELGATIEAAGIFWNNWWFGRGPFSPEHTGSPEYLCDGFFVLRLLPTSGFESLDDIRNYLLQYYTESWVDSRLLRGYSVFVEYNNILYFSAARACADDLNWETAEHILVEQDGNHAIVETTVIAWAADLGEYFEIQRRFIFIDGRISY